MFGIYNWLLLLGMVYLEVIVINLVVFVLLCLCWFGLDIL